MFLVTIQEIYPASKLDKQSIISHYIIKENTEKIIKALSFDKILRDFDLDSIEKIDWSRRGENYKLEVTKRHTRLICSRLRRPFTKKFFINITPFYTFENFDKYSAYLTHKNEKIRNFIRGIFDGA